MKCTTPVVRGLLVGSCFYGYLRSLVAMEVGENMTWCIAILFLIGVLLSYFLLVYCYRVAYWYIAILLLIGVLLSYCLLVY